MEKHQIEYANKIIDFVVKRKNVKNVNLNIKPDMTIEVTANDKVPLDFIFEFVKSKGSWILKNVGHFKEVQPLKQSEQEYVSGETFKYLGKQYRLRVQKAMDEEVGEILSGIHLFVCEGYWKMNPESQIVG